MNSIIESIAIEITPNPNAIKFVVHQNVSMNNPQAFYYLEECKSSLLAKNLLSIEGVKIVFFNQDFITITKSDDADWSSLTDNVKQIIAKHFDNQLPVYIDVKTDKENVVPDKNNFDDGVEKHIKQVIEDYIKPAIAMDGGGIIYHGFIDGMVRLTLIGACDGCPQSEFTLKQGIETTLKYHIPEVQGIEVVK